MHFNELHEVKVKNSMRFQSIVKQQESFTKRNEKPRLLMYTEVIWRSCYVRVIMCITFRWTNFILGNKLNNSALLYLCLPYL